MKEIISENLSELRRKTGKTQKEVAKEVGISAVTLSAYETGQKEPLLSYAVKLAEYYNVTLDNLCGLDCKDRKKTDAAIEPYERKMITASDVVQTIISLSEIADECDMRTDADGRQTTVDIRIRQKGTWLHDFIRDQNKILEFVKTSGLDPSVYETWRKGKFSELKNFQI